MTTKTIRKLLISCLIILAISTIGFTPAHAQEQIITVGYVPNYGIINEPIVRGSEGYGYEFLSEIEKNSNYSFEYLPVSWSEGMEKLKTGEIDLFGPASITDERQEEYNYIETPFSYEISNIYTLEESDLHYGEIQKLDGLTVGVAKGSIYIDYFAEYAKKHNIEYRIEFIEHTQAIQDMESGKIDVYLDSSLYIRDGVKIIDEIYYENLYLITRKGHTILSNAINSIMVNLEIQTPYSNELLWYKYYGDVQKATQQLTEEEKNALKSKDVYTVGYHSDLHPLSYKTNNGEPAGYAVDIMHILAKKLDIKLQFIPLHDEQNNSADNVDFNLCILGSECSEHGQLSAPYDSQGLILLTDSNLNNSDIKNILTFDYASIHIENFLSSYSDAQIHTASSTREINNFYKDVDINGRIVLESTAQMLFNNSSSQEYKIALLGVDVPIGIMVSNHLPKKAITALNKTIATLDDNLVNGIVLENATKLKNETTIISFLNQYTSEIISILVFIGISTLFIYLRLVKEHAKKLKKLVEVDAITGLMTPTKLEKEALSLLKTAKPNEYYLISFDVDNFKVVNQTVGFEKGNALLVAIADSMRKYTSEGTLLCRYSDDIFAVFAKAKSIQDFTSDKLMFSQERCDEIAEKAGIKTPIHFSAGVYYIDDPNKTVDYAIDCVKKARLLAKQKHGNNTAIYTEELKLQVEKETLINNTMEQAVKDEEFFILIQPKIELETGKLVGGEVLVRWENSAGAFIYPDEFIPLFEKNYFIITLDKYVFEQTCKFVKSTNANLPCISVNVSAVSLLEKDFIESYLNILNKYELSPNQFEIELTESAFSDDFEGISVAIKKAKEIGFLLSIDDFGKGASSLSRLKELDVDTIKLDKGFIINNFNLEKGRLSIANVITLINNLGFATLAEGIETQEQLNVLREFGCDLGQGYFFDKPLTPEKFLEKAVLDSKQSYPKVIKSNETIKKYLTDFENLPFGIGIIKNDPHSTIIKANKSLYNLIGHTKEELFKLHENRLSEIMVDYLYPDVVERISANKNDMTLNFRIRKLNGDIVLLHDCVRYDKDMDIFIVTLSDITDQSMLSSSNLSYDAYQAEQESLLFINDMTSEFISISDIETDEIVFMNKNALRLYGFSSEKDWSGKQYKLLAYAKDDCDYENYYNTLNEKGVATREYHNNMHNKHFHTESRIITVLGKKMRLDLVTDITEKKQIEQEINIQSTLYKCIEHLYTSTTSTSNKTTTTSTFENMLEQLRLYYNADRVYFYKFFDNTVETEAFYEVVKDGVKSAVGSFEKIPKEVRLPLIELLSENETIHQQLPSVPKGNSKNVLSDAYSEHQVYSFTYCAVHDTEGTMIGFVGVDNPKDNQKNTELMLLLSRFIWMFIKSTTAKQLEKENLKLEEISKINVIENCANRLKDLNHPDESIESILDSLRNHYGSNCAVVLSINEDRQTFNIMYSSYSNDISSKLLNSENLPIEIISKQIDLFEQNLQLTETSIDEMELSSTEKEIWQKHGFTNAVSTPMYDKNGMLSGIFSLYNLTTTNRSKALVHTVAKNISDYLEQIAMQKLSKVDSLTGLKHKMATQDEISNLLEHGCEGVLFMIDIDYFKTINDTLGHNIGDKVLVDLAFSLKNIFRSSDIIGRVGGDEFMVFCPNALDENSVKTKAFEILDSCNRIYEDNGLSVKTSVSIGISHVDETCNTFDKLYKKADDALYDTKRSGRNHFSTTQYEKITPNN